MLTTGVIYIGFLVSYHIISISLGNIEKNLHVHVEPFGSHIKGIIYKNLKIFIFNVNTLPFRSVDACIKLLQLIFSKTSKQLPPVFLMQLPFCSDVAVSIIPSSEFLAPLCKYWISLIKRCNLPTLPPPHPPYECRAGFPPPSLVLCMTFKLPD